MGNHESSQKIKWEHLLISLSQIILRIRFNTAMETAERCPCDIGPRIRTNIFQKVDHAEIGISRQIHCCISDILGSVDQNATIKWFFNRQPLLENDSRTFCRKETLLIKKMTKSDEGVYECSVKSSNGTTGFMKLDLKILVKGTLGYREAPKGLKVSSAQICAEEGERAELSCEAMVGSGREPKWWFFKPSDELGEYKLLSMPEEIVIDNQPNGKGVIKSTIVIDAVTKQHYGKYECEINNDYQTSEPTQMNITLKEGDPIYCGHSSKSMLFAISASAVVGIFLWIFYCWWRCRRSITLWLRRSSRSHPADVFRYDVFIIHGQSESTWNFVENVLMSRLENKYDYSCFNPLRDMQAGEHINDAICSAMSKCRKILVVITPCLLQSNWVEYTVQHGVHTCHTSSAKMMAIVLQELDSSDESELVKTLATIKKIKIPKMFEQHEEDENDQDTCAKAPREIISEKIDSNKRQSDLLVKIPIYLEDPSIQGNNLLNKLTGSNCTSMVDGLEKVMDEKLNFENIKRSIDHIQDLSTRIDDDPGSPCAKSPFISSSSNCSNEQLPVCGCNTICACIHHALVGNPQTQFWQDIRLFLDSPFIFRMRNLTEESTA